MVELVDTHVSGACVARHEGSSPFFGTRDVKRPSFSLAANFAFMATVYILCSENLDRFYTGSCVEFQPRFEDHLYKIYPESFTSKSEDWKLFLLIENLSYSQARSIEIHR